MTPPTAPFTTQRRGPVRYLLIALGTVALALGALGLVLPILPATPFLLLAAAAYARASDRLHAALLASPAFGPVIRDWQTSRTISRRAKWTAILLLALTIGASVIFVVDALALRVLLVGIGLAVGVFLARIPITV